MPRVDGLEATRRILADHRTRSPASSSSRRSTSTSTCYDALRAGASGFLLKDGPAEQLVAAIRVVADGGALLAPTVTRRLIEEFARRAPPRATGARSPS